MDVTQAEVPAEPSGAAGHTRQEGEGARLAQLLLPPISVDSNKYSRGSLLVLAGSKRYAGAGVLAVLAAEKTGAGYVSLATPANAAQSARQHLLCSPVIEALEHQENGCFASTALPALLSGLHPVKALCLGPGLTVCENTIAFTREVVQYASREHLPLLLDADALNALAAEPTLLDVPRTAPLILTPHQGELARLCGAFGLKENQGGEPEQAATRQASLEEEGQAEASLTRARPNESSATKANLAQTNAVKANPAKVAESLADKLNAVVVAKGPTTFIAADGRLYGCSEATPALAKAGTGDVLAGIISSLLAQGMRAGEAALLGVRIHSRAGVCAELRQGRRSVVALDVINAIPEALFAFEPE